MILLNWKSILCLAYLNIVNLVSSLDLSSITSNILDTGTYYLFHRPVCHFRECCSEKEIPADFNKLERLLKERVYGQHIAQDIVVKALRAHWNDSHQPSKALTLSFHGRQGGGKNYITNFIVDSLYARGSSSSHVHHFISRIHFRLSADIQQLQNNIYNWIKGNVTRCAKQLFIFDEVDQMPSQILDIIKPLIDYNRNIENVDYRKAIFIFLSNTAGHADINGIVLDYLSKGVNRENIRLRDFESLIERGAFKDPGGLHHADTIKDNLIDHYVPFLPLEKLHVEMCVKYEFQKHGINNPTQEHIDDVLQFVVWEPPEKPLFSLTGCKRISQKVSVHVHKYYRNTEL